MVKAALIRDSLCVTVNIRDCRFLYWLLNLSWNRRNSRFISKLHSM